MRKSESFFRQRENPVLDFFNRFRRLWPSSRVLLRGRTVGYTEPVNLLSVAERIHRIEYFGRRRVP